MDDESEDDLTTPPDIQLNASTSNCVNAKSKPVSYSFSDEPSSVQIPPGQVAVSEMDDGSEYDLTTPPDIQPSGNRKSKPVPHGLCDEPSSVQLSAARNVATISVEVSEDEDKTPPAVPRKKETYKSRVKYHWRKKFVR